ncbi:MAG: S8 family serine peptidase [Chloroflexi bacterium]|nr:S8 family serine peptidase [Chloroflexota bacterium]
MLGAASEQPGVLRVDTVIPPRRLQSQTRVISQGVGLHGADVWHNAGYGGSGVKVGIIDGGFEGFSNLQGSELPANVTARCYFEGPQRPSADFADCVEEGTHGTAVAETLIDVAPNAELYITNAYSRGDLRDAVDWMAGQGVEVVNVSLGWTYDGPGDGTSPSSNSPLKTIDAAVSNGITWVNASGNEAFSVWYGPVSDPDGNGWLHFSGNREVNPLLAENGDSLFAIMRWDDDWGSADCDLDLVLLQWDAGNETWVPIEIDAREQDGTAGSIPMAWVGVDRVVDEGRHYALAMGEAVCSTSPDWIQLIAWDSAVHLYQVSRGHHMGNPEESRSAGMLAVGAAHYWNTNTIAEYSSRGPTMDGRTKPDITGVACGTTTTDTPLSVDGRQCWFSGTSQAAPHVAGMAALVKQRFPDYSPADVVRYLEQNAVDRGSTGADNTWGHGMAALPLVEASAPNPALASPPTGNIEVSDGTNPGEVVVSWDAVDEATYYRIGYVNMVTDYPLAKASNTGEWLEAFVYVDVNALNFVEQGGRVEYTVRRLALGVEHAFTVLTSNDVENTKEHFGGKYSWPSNPRWTFHTTAP